ncbi:MAG: sensor histidine kinase [Rhodospirillales bacterium]
MSRFRVGSSVRVNLVAIIGLILIVGFATSSAISYQVSKRSLRDALIGNELPLTSDNIYSEIQRDLLRPVFVAQMMANDTFVRDWLLEGEVDSSRMIRFLREIRDKHGMFTSFLVSDDSRRYYHFSGISQIVSEDDPKDAWYFRVRSMADEHEINVDLNEEQQNALTIFINQKVFDYDGNYIAATGVGIAFEALATVVDRYKENFSRHVYFVDSDGKVMVRSEGASIVEDNIRQDAGATSIADDLLSTSDGSFEYDRNGETMLVSARHIPELDWWIIIEQEEAAALVGVRQSLITNFFVGLVAISLTLVIVLYAVNLFYARLEEKAVEMAELAEHEARLNRQLKYESETKDRFFSIISHDLISPFSSLLSGTEMMSKRAESETKEELVRVAGMVHERGLSVFNLLRNLLDWARLQIEGGSLNPEVVPLRDVADYSIGVLAPTAEEKGVTIENAVRDEAAFADPHAVNAVMRNLVSNAIKFTPSGGKVRVSSSAADGDVQVTVSDTGVGIPQARLATIFDLDRMSSTSGTSNEQGTGLGLILCKEMIELNGGTFWIESAEGEGSQFHFTLPDRAG